jgi:hypothetical protein
LPANAKDALDGGGRTRSTGEVGNSFIQQLSTLVTHRDFSSARIAPTCKRLFTESAYFLQSAEALPDLKAKDLRVNTERGPVAPISSHGRPTGC